MGLGRAARDRDRAHPLVHEQLRELLGPGVLHLEVRAKRLAPEFFRGPHLSTHRAEIACKRGRQEPEDARTMPSGMSFKSRGNVPTSPVIQMLISNRSKVLGSPFTPALAATRTTRPRR
jgi:hypothetical protein